MQKPDTQLLKSGLPCLESFGGGDVVCPPDNICKTCRLFAVNEKTAFSLQTCISERDILRLLPTARDSRWGFLYFPPWSQRSLLAPDGVHGLHILPPMWEERGDRTGPQGRGEKTRTPCPYPYLIHGPHLPFQRRDKHMALKGPLSVETIVSEKWRDGGWGWHGVCTGGCSNLKSSEPGSSHL